MRRYFKEVRLRQLRALVELARHRSFTRAAKSLKLSAPSVWQQVRALEEEFDVSLIAMRGQKVELTEDAQRYLAQRSIKCEILPTIKAVESYNKSKLRKATLIHVTC